MAKVIGGKILYSINEISDLMGITRTTVYKYVREGKMRGVKVGVSTYVTKDDVDEYLGFETQIDEDPVVVYPDEIPDDIDI